MKVSLIGCSPAEATNSSSISVELPASNETSSSPLATLIPFGRPLIVALKSRSFVPSLEMLSMIEEFWPGMMTILFSAGPVIDSSAYSFTSKTPLSFTVPLPLLVEDIVKSSVIFPTK